MKPLVILLLLLVASGASQAQDSGTSASRAAERIARWALLSGALPRDRVDIRSLDVLAGRTDQSLDVAMAIILVSVFRNNRGGEYHQGTLKSSAELANTKVSVTSEMLNDRNYVVNTAKVTSAREDVINAASTGEAFELKWNQEFGPDDAREVVQILPLLKAASDAGLISKAMQAFREELGRSPELLIPFAAEKSATPELVKSRQRVNSLVAEARRSSRR